MNSILSIVFSVCLIGFVSCGREDLYKQVFGETTPKLDRAEVIKMLNDLKSFYQDDPEKKIIIDVVLERSQISEDRCGKCFYIGEVTGRARDLLEETKRSQREICRNLWEASALRSIASLNKNDETFADSLIRSMIDANGGKDFTGCFLDFMPYVPAQRGVMRFMEQKSKTKFTKWAKQDKFDKLFDSMVYEPCGRIVDSLDGALKGYVDLVFRFDYVKTSNVDPIALAWAKRGLICRKIRGYGYSSHKYHSFRKDLFYNLKNL